MHEEVEIIYMLTILLHYNIFGSLVLGHLILEAEYMSGDVSGADHEH